MPISWPPPPIDLIGEIPRGMVGLRLWGYGKIQGRAKICQNRPLERELWKIASLENQGSLKNQEYTPRDAQIMLLDSGHLNYPENQYLTAQRSPKVVL